MKYTEEQLKEAMYNAMLAGVSLEQSLKLLHSSYNAIKEKAIEERTKPKQVPKEEDLSEKEDTESTSEAEPQELDYNSLVELGVWHGEDY